MTDPIEEETEEVLLIDLEVGDAFIGVDGDRYQIAGRRVGGDGILFLDVDDFPNGGKTHHFSYGGDESRIMNRKRIVAVKPDFIVDATAKT